MHWSSRGEAGECCGMGLVYILCSNGLDGNCGLASVCLGNGLGVGWFGDRSMQFFNVLIQVVFRIFL